MKLNFLISLILIFSFLHFQIYLYFDDILESKKIKIFDELIPFIDENQTKPKSLKEIYQNNILYINDGNITNEYIKFIRSIEKLDSNTAKAILWKNKKFDEKSFPKRKDQLNYKQFGKLCNEEKIINSNIKYRINKNPLISVIVPTFNKEKILLKSIRSIQNQSLKNIEIIIVDDSSKDNSSKIYNYLLKSDPRIRVFYHLKNLGLWRSRIDGFLYSKGKYVILFDSGDLYEDNYVLEDSYNTIKKYDIDTVKSICRYIFDFKNISNSRQAIIIDENYTKIAYKPHIKEYDEKYFKPGWIWTTLVKRKVYTKSLKLLSNRVLNLYKNYWDDQWWKYLVNIVSNSLLILKRYSYLYFIDGKGEGNFKNNTEEQRNKMIQEHLGFLLFDIEILPKTDNKREIINKLKLYNNNNYIINFGFLRSKFYLLEDLLNDLIL